MVEHHPHTSETTLVALLRGIGPGTNQIAMDHLRALCVDLGWQDVRTYIQSGNVVFRSSKALAALEAELEVALAQRFGLRLPVIARSAVQWDAYVRHNPMAEAAAADASRVLLALSKAPPRADVVERLRAMARNGERIEQAGDAIWIHYVSGVGRSKLSPGTLDRAFGSPVTTRNWRTVMNLHSMLQPAEH